MKITLWILLGLVVAAAVMYLVQWVRQKRVQRDGVAVYATVISSEPLKRFGKNLGMTKFVLWVQEPSGASREVSISGRVEPGKAPTPGTRLPVVVDPTNPLRVYPANEEAMARITMTGPRRERRAMDAQTSRARAGRAVRGQGQQAPGRGPMPPPRGRRG